MNPNSLTPAGPSDNTGKMMTRRIKAHDRSTVVLSYSSLDANSLRVLVQRIRLKGTKKPSLSLLARRSLGLYMDRMRSHPDFFASEVTELDRLVTPVPSPAPRSKKRSA